MGIRMKSTVSNTVLYVILVLMSIVWLTPFACILLESFRTESTGRVGYIIPKQWGFDNYINLWTKTSFPIWFRNTLITALATAVLQTLMVLSVSYVLSRLRFKGRKLLMNTCLVLGMFPGFVTMIVLYKVLSGMGLTGANSVPGLILVYCASSGMGYYVSKGFFDTIPKSLAEAARVDGASRFMDKLRTIDFTKVHKAPETLREIPYLYIDADEDHVALQFHEHKGDVRTNAQHRKDNCVLAKMVYVYEGIEPKAFAGLCVYFSDLAGSSVSGFRNTSTRSSRIVTRVCPPMVQVNSVRSQSPASIPSASMGFSVSRSTIWKVTTCSSISVNRTMSPGWSSFSFPKWDA